MRERERERKKERKEGREEGREEEKKSRMEDQCSAVRATVGTHAREKDWPWALHPAAVPPTCLPSPLKTHMCMVIHSFNLHKHFWSLVLAGKVVNKTKFLPSKR